VQIFECALAAVPAPFCSIADVDIAAGIGIVTDVAVAARVAGASWG